MLILFLLIPALLMLWNAFYSRHWRRGLSVCLSFSAPAAYARTQIGLTEEILNRKKLPLPELEVGFRIRKGLRFFDAENVVVSDYVYKRDIFSMRGMESVTRRYRLECMSRGRYKISQIVVSAYSLPHQAKYIMELPDTARLSVYAAWCDVSAIMDQCDTLLGIRESPRSLFEDPFAFASIREYTCQDPMKNINWKASARTGALMVNTFASVQAQSYMIFLDVSDRRILKCEALVEYGISAAASLCRKLAANGQDLGLVVNTDPPALFGPGRGGDLLSGIEEFLTTDFERVRLSDFETLSALEIRAQAGIGIVISPEEDSAARLAEAAFAAGKLRSLLLVVPVNVEGQPVLRLKTVVGSRR